MSAWLRTYLIWIVCTFVLGVIQFWLMGLLFVFEESNNAFRPDSNMVLIFCSLMVSGSAFNAWTRSGYFKRSKHYFAKHIVFPLVVLALIALQFFVNIHSASHEDLSFSVVSILALSFIYGSVVVFSLYNVND